MLEEEKFRQCPAFYHQISAFKRAANTARRLDGRQRKTMGRGDITGKLSKSKPKGAVISFNEEARKSFLTGFRKRKNDRRQYARQKIAEQVRQEKLSARQERRTMQKQALASAVSEDEEDGSDAELLPATQPAPPAASPAGLKDSMGDRSNNSNL